MVARRQLVDDRLQYWHQLRGDCRPLNIADHIRPQQDVGLAIPAPDHAFFHHWREPCQLRQRYRSTARGWHHDIGQLADVARRRCATPGNINQLRAFAHLRDRDAVQHRLQGDRERLARDTEFAHLVFIDDHVHALALGVPVDIDVLRVRVFAHLGRQQVRVVAQRGDIVAVQAKLHGIIHRRAVAEYLRPRTHTGKAAVGIIENFGQLFAQGIARLDILAHDDVFGKIGIVQLQILAQLDTRRSVADITGIARHSGVGGQNFLQLAGGILRRAH